MTYCFSNIPKRPLGNSADTVSASRAAKASEARLLILKLFIIDFMIEIHISTEYMLSFSSNINGNSSLYFIGFLNCSLSCLLFTI